MNEHDSIVIQNIKYIKLHQNKNISGKIKLVCENKNILVYNNDKKIDSYKISAILFETTSDNSFTLRSDGIEIIFDKICNLHNVWFFQKHLKSTNIKVNVDSNIKGDRQSISSNNPIMSSSSSSVPNMRKSNRPTDVSANHQMVNVSSNSNAIVRSVKVSRDSSAYEVNNTTKIPYSLVLTIVHLLSIGVQGKRK